MRIIPVANYMVNKAMFAPVGAHGGGVNHDSDAYCNYV